MTIPAMRHKQRPWTISENIQSHMGRPSRMLWGRVSSSCCCYCWTFLSVSIDYWQHFGSLPDSSLNFIFISLGSNSLQQSISSHPELLGGQSEEAALDVGAFCTRWPFLPICSADQRVYLKENEDHTQSFSHMCSSGAVNQKSTTDIIFQFLTGPQ